MASNDSNIIELNKDLINETLNLSLSAKSQYMLFTQLFVESYRK